jgi:hypothetical protein
LNPTFGYGSDLVGGADADLIVDGCLIDIKTTKKWSLSTDYIYQLIGYYILHRLNEGGINERDTCQIKRVGIYFSRHGEMCAWDVNTIISEEGIEALCQFFEETASQLGSVAGDAMLSELPTPYENEYDYGDV